ncbi:MAG: TonB-dependent receptor [Chitinophagaceae bacterium]|jgi:outer membrane receptor for ferrienterochelin and colicins|nr:TonB-dependent receptor [Chitinophagaceae bacterium]MBK7678582.1 TonB-dependent receptor [Chitinophagaceae bacterium]MBK8300072.1 TonB-dependent receptor [Chitinophagaceae bacterium]MBK9658764.1 TonB-dependent receptor [Chitinophagaceae bacterium]MBK9939502.1 TonB-dependent receptor [Chitinophagaceae bacterium]
MRKVYLLIITVTINQLLTAQQIYFSKPEDTTKAKELSEVVVTGQYKPQSARNSVYQVRIISKERIQKQGAASLQDVLKNELNVRFAQDPATGGSGITMLGLSGQNVKVLVDGLPMLGRQGASNEIDINQVDVNSIERIELVEGPMSVVYGADALAGVINIITKKSGAAKFTVNARLHEESVGNEYGIKQGIHNQYAGFTTRYKNWEAGGSFGHNYFGGWKDTAIGRELVWHKKDQLLANGFVGYTKGKFSARYRLDGLDEIITNPGNFLPYADANSGDTLAYDQEYLSQRIMQQLQASYFASNNLNVQLQTSYSDYSRQVFSTTINKKNGDTRLDPGSGRQSVVNFKGFTFRSSVYYKVSSLLSFQPGVDINLESGEGERLKEGSNRVNDYAFFITSEITPSKKINIRPGLRFIKNSVYDAPPVIPSLNTKIVLTKDIDLRLSYAKGFRSPSLRELYFSFFDANHQVIGNPELMAETSNSFTGSLNWKKISTKGVVYTSALGGFYNQVKNMIDYVFTQASDTARLYNVANSKTGGVHINSTAKYKSLSISAGASYTGFYNIYSATDKSLPELQWSPEANIIAGYSFSAIRLDVNLFYKFTGKRPRYVTNGPDIILAETDGFHIADITLNKQLFSYFSLSAGVKNIFDTDRINSSFVSGGIHSSGGLNVGTGRSFFAGLVFNWEKK